LFDARQKSLFPPRAARSVSSILADDGEVEPFQPSLFAQYTGGAKQELALKLRDLATRGVLIGTSSWRYEGWLGSFYTPERYFSRGRFSKTRFQAECIQEYAETFPVAGGDFSFYGAPTPQFWRQHFSRSPKELLWSFKAPEDFTVKRFPMHPRYGPRAGQINPAFLDATLFRNSLLEPLAPYLDRVATVIFEFGTFSSETYPDPRRFYDDLSAFLDALPAAPRFSIELRNADFLRAEYFNVLKSHSAAHVFNSWTRMPALAEQLQMADSFTATHTVSRALLRPGREYGESVAMFSRYAKTREEYPEGRDALRRLIRKSIERGRTAYIHVNNRFEGNAIETIRAIV
jgi:uncharacterized protein YecE (DUF72 family)